MDRPLSMMGDDDIRSSDVPEASVIVPCAGALEDLDELVASLVAQDAPFSWEVVFVDNGVGPAERTRLERAAAAVPAGRVVSEGERGISPARNAGARASRGRTLAFVDADDVAAPSWLRALSEAAAPGWIAAGTLELDRLNPPWLAASRGDRQPDAEPYLCEGIFPVAPGGNMAIDRGDFTALGGFGAGAESLEDFELCWRAWKAGIDVRRAPAEATIHYRLQQQPRVLFRQGFRYGKARARTYRRLVDEGLVPRLSIAGWRSWAKLLTLVPFVAWRASDRALAAWIAGNRLGRLAGSAEHRVVYL
jgi:glycosyltransferase involved in cell wall biosynthesis